MILPVDVTLFGEHMAAETVFKYIGFGEPMLFQ